MPNATTPAQYFLILIDMVEGPNCTREQLLEGTSLQEKGIAGIGARVRDQDFTQLVLNAQSLTGDPALGLKLGLRLNLSAHAIVGQAFMACGTLEEALQLLLKYHHLLANSLDMGLEITDELCALTIASTPEEADIEFGYELVYGAIINTLRGLLNQPDLCLRMEMPYPRPAHAEQYFDVFGPDVHFNCVRGRILYDKSLLQTALPSSNPVLMNLYEAECARLLTDLEGESSISEQTLRLLRKLEGQYPQMPQIAAMLNFSPRTYRRRLDDEKSSFQALLDQVRAEHATRYLQNTRLPLSSIAYMVGFSDASNFRRAYTKWTGRSPREVRDG
ncbi:MAG: AraC family transcriptional regulator [Halioglobus sp.]